MANPSVLTLGTFNALVYLIRNQKDMDWVCEKYKIRKDTWLPKGLQGLATWTSTKDGEIMTVSLAPSKLTPTYAALAAHEATHIMQYAIRAIADESPSNEIQARLVEQVTKFLLEN